MNVLHGEFLSAVSQRRRAFLRTATEDANGGSSTYPQRRGVDYDAMAAQQGDVLEKLSALRATYASRAQKELDQMPTDIPAYSQRGKPLKLNPCELKQGSEPSGEHSMIATNLRMR